MIPKNVHVFLKGQAKKSYLALQRRHDKEAQSLLRSIDRLQARLRENPQYGQPVPRRLYPKSLAALGIQNLYRAELAQYWCALYTIEGDEVGIYLFILTIADHKTYDRMFGYA